MTIADIKQNLTIRQVLEHYQIQTKNNSCCCPFHEDKKPSMQIFPDTHTVRCYSGNCQQSNKVIDVIDFIMYKENLTKHEALLKASQLTDLSHKIQRSKEYQEIPLDRLEELFYKMKSNLRQSKTAREYTEKRALDYQKLEIGYNGRTYKGLVNCIVFPLKDARGKIVSLYGRTIKQ
ncbi:hypothetical protein ETU10_00150, partial [Apibacter muscae]|uniref:CHC2 zinc finger domain-containing protein n=1 Tax=Apibacter muscae TaxID=2509004 RepID=UPI0011AC0559